MLGDLNADIIGTNPQYPKIVDQSWLNVDLGKYDNFPSDNNPVRIVPKLSDLWNHSPAQTSVSIIPNSKVLPLGIRSSEEDAKTVEQVVREAKKAVMAGLKGKALSQHLRARFASKYIELAKDELQRISQEIGLLGNVYIDASAFDSYKDAERFLSQHRNRLARDILLNSEKMSPNVVSVLASTFHRNVVVSVEYNDELLKKYKDHLVQAGRIPADFVVDSKETLRQAFLYEKPVVSAEAPEIKEKKLDEKKIKEGFEQMVSEREIAACETQDSLLLSRISPVVSFVQESLSKGKTASDVKDMVKARFVLEDIKVAAEALGVVLSKEGLSAEHVDCLVSEGKISLTLGKELKKIEKKFPMVKTEIEEVSQPEKAVGVQGFLYTPSGKPPSDQFDSYRTATVEAMKKGFDTAKIKEKLMTKLSSVDADRVLAEAVSLFNSIPAGFTANKPEKVKTAAVIAEPEPKQTLPDPLTIPSQLEDIYRMFEGSEMIVDMNPSRDYTPQEVDSLFNREGLDQVI
jgi:hypothetical protein